MEPPSRPFRAAHALHPSPPPISAFRAVASPSPIRVQLTSSRRVSDQRPSATQPRSKVRSTQPNRSSGYAPPLPQQTATPSTHTLRASTATSPHLLNGSSSRHHRPLRVSAPSPPISRHHHRRRRAPPRTRVPGTLPFLAANSETRPDALVALRPLTRRQPHPMTRTAHSHSQPRATPTHSFAPPPFRAARRPNHRPAIPRSVSTTTLRAARQPTTRTAHTLSFSTRANAYPRANATPHSQHHRPPQAPPPPSYAPPPSPALARPRPRPQRATQHPQRRETTPDPPVPQNHLTPPTYPHPRAARNPRARDSFRRRISPPGTTNSHTSPLTRHNQLPHLHTQRATPTECQTALRATPTRDLNAVSPSFWDQTAFRQHQTHPQSAATRTAPPPQNPNRAERTPNKRSQRRRPQKTEPNRAESATNPRSQRKRHPPESTLRATLTTRNATPPVAISVPSSYYAPPPTPGARRAGPCPLTRHTPPPEPRDNTTRPSSQPHPKEIATTPRQPPRNFRATAQPRITLHPHGASYAPRPRVRNQQRNHPEPANTAPHPERPRPQKPRSDFASLGDVPRAKEHLQVFSLTRHRTASPAPARK